MGQIHPQPTPREDLPRDGTCRLNIHVNVQPRHVLLRHRASAAGYSENLQALPRQARGVPEAGTRGWV